MATTTNTDENTNDATTTTTTIEIEHVDSLRDGYCYCFFYNHCMYATNGKYLARFSVPQGKLIHVYPKFEEVKHTELFHRLVVHDKFVYMISGEYDDNVPQHQKKKSIDMYKIDLQQDSSDMCTVLPNNTMDCAPSERANSSLIGRTSGSHLQSLVLFGGFNTEYQNDLWEYSLEHGTWQELPQDRQLATRCAHACCYNKHADTMIMFSGYNGEYSDELLEYSFAQQKWITIYEQNPVDRPVPCCLHSMIMIGTKLFITTGQVALGYEQSSHVWEMDMRTHMWKQYKAMRNERACCFFDNQESLYVFHVENRELEQVHIGVQQWDDGMMLSKNLIKLCLRRAFCNVAIICNE